MIQKIKNLSNLTPIHEKNLVNFLFEHLEKFGDPKDQIQSCINYAKNPALGGHIYCVEQSSQIKAACIVLNTHMKGFIPPYILVYIAVHEDLRGQGIGKKMISFIQNDLNEAIALHVENKNPAKRLYERLGFTHKYLEMRWTP